MIKEGDFEILNNKFSKQVKKVKPLILQQTTIDQHRRPVKKAKINRIFRLESLCNITAHLKLTILLAQAKLDGEEVALRKRNRVS